MKPETDTTGLFNRGYRGFRGYDTAEAVAFPISAIRVIRGSIFLLLALFCSVVLADAATMPADASEASPLANPFGVDLDSLECITASEIEEEPTLICDNSPNPWNDRDELSLPLNQKARIPSRSDHLFSTFTLPPSSFSLTRRPGIIPAFLFPTHSSDSLHAHIRERAPPTLA